jgi:outer membrane protein TolC
MDQARQSIVILAVAAVALAGCGPAYRPYDPRAQTYADAIHRSGHSGQIDPARWDDDGQPLVVAPESLAEAQWIAARSNASLRAAWQQVQAAREQIPQARALPDPQLSYSYYLRHVETRVGPQRHAVRLAQTLPAPGTLSLAGERAAARARAALATFQAQHLTLRKQVTAAWARLYHLGQAIRLTDANRQLLADLEQVALTLYKTDRASRGDVIRLQVERGRLADRLESLRRRMRPERARLEALLGRKLDEAFAAPGSLELPPDRLDRAELNKQMRDASPRLARARARIDAARRLVELAGKAYWPSVTVGLGWIQTDRRHHVDVDDNGKDPWIVSASMNLPVWLDKLQAGLRQARARRMAAGLELAQLQRDLQSELDAAVFEYQDARRRAQLYRQLILPKAREALEVRTAEFRTGQASFAEWIEAQQVALEFQLAYRKALADALTAAGGIEELTASPLPEANPDQGGTSATDPPVETMP